MIKFGEKVVKLRFIIFILSFVLLVPAGIGYINTRVNYDIMSYLPKDIETMKGQDILVDQFGTGAYSFVVCDGLKEKEVSDLRKQIEKIDHVESVLWYDSLLDISVPMTVLPEKVRDVFNAGDDSTLMFVVFDTTTSADETMQAIKDIRKVTGKKCFVSGMSAIVTDTKDLCEKEMPGYIVIAALLSAVVLTITMDSFLIPVLFLLSIGMSIVYNMGSNIFLGEISYITQALTAVLQLGVTMDYSIFLWHSYQESLEEYSTDRKQAMAHAIAATAKSVFGSSITTVAGFVALCFMSFTLGLDLGIVMAKGVVIGVISCITILPSMIMIFDKALEKTKHKPLLPEQFRLSEFIVNHYKIIGVVFVLIFIPAIYCQNHTQVYYNLDKSLPDYLDCSIANTRLEEEYNMGSIHMILLDRGMSSKEKNKMIDEMEKVDGVKNVISLESFVGPMIPESMIPQKVKDILQSKDYDRLLIMNKYANATDEVNEELSELNTILKKYDKNGMLVGEAPCTKDLIEITDKDFKTVSVVSIFAVFIIILIIFKSITLPVLLVCVIECAIFINLGIPYLTGTVLPFIASVVIGTIQLGATVDYAILMTSRYEKERSAGKDKKEAVLIAHQTGMKSVIVSAMSFFAATIGVAVYSGVDMISAICMLLSRGAIVSMVVVLFALPSVLLIFDGLITRTSLNIKRALKNRAE